MRVETFELERWMTTYETEVEFDLAESGIQPLSVAEMVELTGEQEALQSILEMPLGYSEACGTEELRELIAAEYDSATIDNVLVTTGAIEANYLLFNTLLDAGDHVISVHPAYQQLYSVPRAIGCKVDLWRVRSENEFRYDVDELEGMIRPETKMIVINTPHNPTGAVLSAEELARVYELAKRSDAWVLSDEAYRWLSLPGQDALAPPTRELGEHGLSVSTLSKPFGLPGLRIGWMIAPEDVVQDCWSQRDYISLSPGFLNDRLAQIALRHKETLLNRTYSIAGTNLEYLERWIKEREGMVSWVQPRGGLLGLLEYDINMPSEELANYLAEEASVMLAPGSSFEQEYHLRIGLGAEPNHFKEGLEVVADHLERILTQRGPRHGSAGA